MAATLWHALKALPVSLVCAVTVFVVLEVHVYLRGIYAALRSTRQIHARRALLTNQSPPPSLGATPQSLWSRFAPHTLTIVVPVGLHEPAAAVDTNVRLLAAQTIHRRMAGRIAVVLITEGVHVLCAGLAKEFAARGFTHVQAGAVPETHAAVCSKKNWSLVCAIDARPADCYLYLDADVRIAPIFVEECVIALMTSSSSEPAGGKVRLNPRLVVTSPMSVSGDSLTASVESSLSMEAAAFGIAERTVWGGCMCFSAALYARLDVRAKWLVSFGDDAPLTRAVLDAEKLMRASKPVDDRDVEDRHWDSVQYICGMCQAESREGDLLYVMRWWRRQVLLLKIYKNVDFMPAIVMTTVRAVAATVLLAHVRQFWVVVLAVIVLDALCASHFNFASKGAPFAPLLSRKRSVVASWLLRLPIFAFLPYFACTILPLVTDRIGLHWERAIYKVKKMK
jgi:hypothetical protein